MQATTMIPAKRTLVDYVPECKPDNRSTKKIRTSERGDAQLESKLRSFCTRKSPRLAEHLPKSDKRPSLNNIFSTPVAEKRSVASKRRQRHLALKFVPAASLHTNSEKIVLTSQIHHFRKIQDAKVQLVVWQRPSIPTFMVSLADPHLPAYVLPSFKRSVQPDELGSLLKSKTVKLAEAIGQDKTNDLIQDICLLTKEFAAATNVHKVAVKLEHFGDNGCQYWHQDSVPNRLVATYRGPCTEWVHPNYGDATLRRRQANSRHKQTFAHNHVPLFKGRGLSDSGDNTLLKHPGIVHRSPRILGSRIHRLVLVLDLPGKCC